MSKAAAAGGVDIGPEAWRTDFYEQLPVVDVNKQLFSSAGAWWAAPPVGVVLSARKPLASPMSFDTVCEYSEGVVCFKDPRFVWTIDWWSTTDAFVVDGVVLCQRPFDGFADSVIRSSAHLDLYKKIHPDYLIAKLWSVWEWHMDQMALLSTKYETINVEFESSNYQEQVDDAVRFVGGEPCLDVRVNPNKQESE